MSSIKLVTFDATNTLFKVRGSVGEMYAKTAFNYGIKTNPNEIDKNFRKAFNQFSVKYPNFGRTVGMPSKQWWSGVVHHSFDGQVKADILTKISSDLYDNFMTKAHWELFQDVLPTLQHFKNKGINLGVLSNFDERLLTIFTQLNIEKYFIFILASRSTEWCKPSQQIFHHALTMVPGCMASEVIHIGDNLDLDYKAARNAGMDSYLLLRQQSDTKINNLINNVPEHKIITNLEDLCNLT